MKSAIENLTKRYPSIDRHLLQDHWSRLNERYFEQFDETAVHKHLQTLSQLSPEKPVIALFDKGEHSFVSCTVIAYDYNAAFSLITGILGGMGLSVLSGKAFTYAKSTTPASRTMHRRRFAHRRIRENSAHRKKIIDFFSGPLTSPEPFEHWSRRVQEKLEKIFLLLEQGDHESETTAKVLVNELVVSNLKDMNFDYTTMLYPVSIEIDNEAGPFTRMRVFTEDTPFFLYTMSTAFSLHDIAIENVNIRTVDKLVEDEFDIVDKNGKKIEDQDQLSGIRISILLTKQFTYFLSNAPDPYRALLRFEKIVDDLANVPGKEQSIHIISNAHIMHDLAQLLGTSDFLWEDFIRTQYEELIPLLSSHDTKTDLIDPIETLYWRLEEFLDGASSVKEKIDRINRFKDSETFQIDLNHIINHPTDFRKLAHNLTMLAEIIVNMVCKTIYDDLCTRYGTPRTVANLEAKYAVCGLGNFGGAALGYASDIELLFIYSDNGWTDGADRISNAEFFNAFVREVSQAIRAKREGIFTVDLRLRPYGKDGPLACSLDNFCRYYGTGGAAHSYERLALVRLRAAGGDPDFGKQIQRIRDEFLYASQSIDIQELQLLREKQLHEKTRPDKFNAKFSPGALVDLEYTVQLLQVIHGKALHALRTPRIHKALTELARAGVLQEDESLKLIQCYDFLRHLINGLRMLRGSAQDLFLPDSSSIEFVHLARRLGYVKKDTLEPQKQLELEFKTHTAVVRTFIKRHLGRQSLPGPAAGNIADLILTDSVSGTLSETVLNAYGFTNPKRAYKNLKALSSDDPSQEIFAKLAILACDFLTTKPDPDMALNNWERFVKGLADPRSHFELLLSQPMRLDILLSIFSTSQFLSDTLIKYPDFFDWATRPENIESLRNRQQLLSELDSLYEASPSASSWRPALRRFKKRELLRIGTRDICIHSPIEHIVLELSVLADALIQVCLDGIWQRSAPSVSAENLQLLKKSFCIIALGKLGGQELNYSSDIDLLGIYDSRQGSYIEKRLGINPASFYSNILTKLREDLSDHCEEGHAYRVDLRLRPYGRAGRLVYGTNNLHDYYARQASLWEIQALIKMRPVAGNTELGSQLAAMLRPVLLQGFDRQAIISSVDGMRKKSISQIKSSEPHADIKNGPGCMRDIEFAVQGLQLIFCQNHRELICGNTLSAIDLLCQLGIVGESTAKAIHDSYIFLRRVEHVMQIFDDRQIHSLPQDEKAVAALAKRIFGHEAGSGMLVSALEKSREAVQDFYANVFLAMR